MKTGVLVPAGIAAGVILVRAVVGNGRAPYPYEYMSWGLIYGAVGMFDDSGFGEALAWGYLVAMLTAPTFADIWKQIPTGKPVPKGKKSTGNATAKAGSANSQGLPATG